MVNDFSSELPKTIKSAFIAWIAHTLNWTEKAVYLSNDDDVSDQLPLRFPLAYQKDIQHYAAQYHLPNALIYAVIRQESAFKENVVSSAGAYGLMQLMPKTAKQMARQKHIPYQNTKDLFDPHQNIRLGVAYLDELAKQFDNNPLLIIAAYNAGPIQVKRWLKTHPVQAVDIWIETLPWSETRNYIKGVIAFYAVYQHRLNQKANLAAFTQQDINHNIPNKD